MSVVDVVDVRIPFEKLSDMLLESAMSMVSDEEVDQADKIVIGLCMVDDTVVRLSKVVGVSVEFRKERSEEGK